MGAGPIACITMFINSTAEFNLSRDWVAERRGEFGSANQTLLQTLVVVLFFFLTSSNNNLKFKSLNAQISLGLLGAFTAAQQQGSHVRNYSFQSMKALWHVGSHWVLVVLVRADNFIPFSIFT